MAAPSRPSAPRALVNRVADWLMLESLKERDIESLVMGCCERLQAAGVPVARGFFAFAVLHPLHNAIGITWTRGNGTTLMGYPHVPGGISEIYRHSPHYYMRERGLSFMRSDLRRKLKQFEFPVFEDLRRDGMTDYLAFTVNFGTARIDAANIGMHGSWSTDAEDGFSDDDIEALLRVQDRLAVACNLAIKSRLMRNLAETYLGRDAGSRVLDGQIKRGDGQSIQAAIWYADIRDSTAMADSVPPQAYIDALNGFFDATGGAVTAHGGEILSFIGDAILAIFPTDGSAANATKACENALAAGQAALGNVADLNRRRAEEGEAALRFGVGLHLGEVMYGNVGVPERLVFSAFGASVNEVARIEKLTKDIDESILASDTFVAAVDCAWRPLGEHVLSGVGRPMAVCAPPLELCRLREVPQPDGLASIKRDELVGKAARGKAQSNEAGQDQSLSGAAARKSKAV